MVKKDNKDNKDVIKGVQVIDNDVDEHINFSRPTIDLRNQV